MLSLFLGFLLGTFAVFAAEAFAFWFLLKRLARRRTESRDPDSKLSRDLDAEQSLAFLYNKKGVIWILEPEKVGPKESPVEGTAEQMNKKEIVEVFPLKKNAKIKDQSLVLVDSDGSQATIQLVGCKIVAVSASSLSSRKWAKRYPIKVENKKLAIYKGSNIVYIFLETSWEKESWCKALCLASCTDKDKLNWYAKLSEDFNQYLSSLNEEYPFFMKPASVFVEQMDKGTRIDGSSSRVRHFLKKLAKKASRNSADYKTSATSSSVCDERRLSDKPHANQDRMLATSLLKNSSDKTVQGISEDDMVLPYPLTLSHSSSQGQVSNFSDADGDEKFGYDEGTLCWNLLISRLFFDAKRNKELSNSIQARIQRTLSNMRTPSYIGGIVCTGLDLGKLPPYIHNMRVLPMNMKEVWCMEADIEYSGGIILYVETRLEVCEPDFQKGVVNTTNSEPSTAAEATSDLLEGFEFYGNQLKLSSGSAEKTEKGDEGEKIDFGVKSSKNTGWTTTYVSRWKSILNSLADQVSQVPLSLAIRVTSLRGTLRLHVKPPPSDQLWYGFTSMPDIEWNLESAVGDHKIKSSQITVLISNRFKAAIRDTLVIPNCEYICIPLMLAEQDDWVPRQVAPFIWAHQESANSTGRSVSNSQPGEVKIKANTTINSNLHDHKKAKDVMDSDPLPVRLASGLAASSQSGPSKTAVSNDQSLHSIASEDLNEPLLRSDVTDDSFLLRTESPEALGGEIIISGEHSSSNGDMKPKRMGRRAKMMDLGKKMGEKFEEKRRHIEEKGRHIVEKMRENART